MFSRKPAKYSCRRRACSCFSSSVSPFGDLCFRDRAFILFINSFVIIKTSVKHPGVKNEASELVSYVEEAKEEITEENTETSQEVSE